MFPETLTAAFDATQLALLCGAAGLGAAASAWVFRARRRPTPEPPAPAVNDGPAGPRVDVARVGDEIGNPLSYALQNLQHARNLISGAEHELPTGAREALHDAMFGVRRASHNLTRLRLRAAPTTASALDETDPLLGGPVDRRERGRGRILVVDDDEMVGYAVRRGLEHAYVVDVADSGPAALERLGRHEYDLILSDLWMPQMDGMAFFEHACTRDPALAQRFVFMTGSSADPRARAFFDSIPNLCLRKPCGLGQLREAVESTLRDLDAVSVQTHPVPPRPRPAYVAANNR